MLAEVDQTLGIDDSWSHLFPGWRQIFSSDMNNNHKFFKVNNLWVELCFSYQETYCFDISQWTIFNKFACISIC